MITKLRPRYYCEHCNKSGGQVAAMKKHESGCTKNPARVCRMCQISGGIQKPISELIDALKLDDERCTETRETGPRIVPDELRKEAENCPACMLAAMRLSRLDATDFDFSFTAEVKEFFDEVNRHRRDY